MDNINKKLIEQFYTCFQQRDYKGMQACYADNATFTDEVFVDLDAEQVCAMWEMLCIRGKDLKLEFSNVKADETTGSAEWTATYTFSASKRKVVNRIKANFTFENGKIVKHIDQFDFYLWARQALGLSGLLLGWTSFMRNKVQQTAMKNLALFLAEKK
jgi:ketosteroid isomerase-like protein